MRASAEKRLEMGRHVVRVSKWPDGTVSLHSHVKRERGDDGSQDMVWSVIPKLSVSQWRKVLEALSEVSDGKVESRPKKS